MEWGHLSHLPPAAAGRGCGSRGPAGLLPTPGCDEDSEWGGQGCPRALRDREPGPRGSGHVWSPRGPQWVVSAPLTGAQGVVTSQCCPERRLCPLARELGGPSHLVEDLPIGWGSACLSDPQPIRRACSPCPTVSQVMGRSSRGWHQVAGQEQVRNE